MGNAADIVWHIMRGNQQYGPFNRADFERFERECQLLHTDFVWHTGLTDWVRYQDYDSCRTKALTTPSPLKLLRSKAGALYILVKSASRLPISLINTTFSLVARPSAFGRDRIDQKPGDLQRAITFFLNIIGIAFVLFAAMAHLHGYSGLSEIRGIIILTIQFAIACPILYILNRVARQAVHFSGIVQAVLYFDALLQIASVLTGALIGYATPPPEMGRGELDIIATEYEKCLSRQSLTYWLIRGDLQFFMDPVVTPVTTYIEVGKQYLEYVIALPLCVLFARLLKGRYAANALLNTIFAIGTFVAVVTGWQFVRDKVQHTIEMNSTCATTFFAVAAEKYSTRLLGKQIAYRTNQQIAASVNVYKPSVTFTGEKLVMELVSRSGQIESNESTETIRRGGLAFYCGDNTAFIYARQLRIPLLLIVYRQDGSIILGEEQTPAQCR